MILRDWFLTIVEEFFLIYIKESFQNVKSDVCEVSEVREVKGNWL